MILTELNLRTEEYPQVKEMFQNIRTSDYVVTGPKNLRKTMPKNYKFIGYATRRKKYDYESGTVSLFIDVDTNQLVVQSQVDGDYYPLLVIVKDIREIDKI